MQAFKDLGLNDDLIQGITQLGFEVPTPVQAAVIPAALQTSTDFIALAQTGTGKTAAFGLPLLQHIDPNLRKVQALVLCPTRELCIQVAGDLVDYSQFAHQYKVVAVYGGASIDLQIKSLRAGAQIIVATPGRLIDLIERRAVNLEAMARLVLDEADEMLNMGFKEALDTILASATQKKSVWLFSATMSNEIRRIASNYMENPVEINVGGKRNQANENIEHTYYLCRPDDRYATLKRLVDAHPGIYGLIFCRTKADTKEIADQMTRDGYNSDALHGDLSQSDRDRVMSRFREGSLQLLIATDVAARGIDVDGISHVIHYGLPDDVEVYTHRSGRTGRAGKKGTSVLIVTTKFEPRIREIERITKSTVKRLPIPSGEQVCQQQLMQIVNNIKEIEVREEEIAPFMEQINEQLAELTKEELIARFASVEFNRFLSYYKNSIDLNIYPKLAKKRFGDSERSDSRSSERFRRVFVNIGEMDGVTPRDFLRVMSRKIGIEAENIGQIEVKKSFMHFDVDHAFFEQAKTGLQQLDVNGRKVRVDDATSSSRDTYGGTGGGSRHGKDDKKRKRR